MAQDVEEFWIAALNADKTVIAAQCLFRGTADFCPFHPRDVFRFACRHNASTLIVAHSHPSGSVAPSKEDYAITERLMAAADLLCVPVVDHLIIGGRRYFSFLERGLLQAPDSG